MDQIRLKKISESDFDEIIKEAGGSRIMSEDSADYLLNEALIELKLIQEERLEKLNSQKKIAKIFRAQQPDVPVVVIDSESLDEAGQRAYYNVIIGPIEDRIRKGSNQLEKTAKRYNPQPVRILVILNIGFTALSLDEFKTVCVRCAQKPQYIDGIDWIICGGVYFYSDKFDSFLIEPFEAIPINLRSSFPSFSLLDQAWGTFAERTATDLMRNKTPFSDGRMPVLDLPFEIDGVRYVKPAPKMPKSSFWPSGRAPRDNTTGFNKSPPVARTCPSLSESDWKQFKDVFPSAHQLKSSYKDWLQKHRQESEASGEKLKPLVSIKVSYEEFSKWISKPKDLWRYSDVCQFANQIIEGKIRAVLERLKDKGETKILLPEYIHLVVREIGQDKANDLCSIVFVSETPGFERKETILKNEKLFFEFGATVAAAYAVQRNVDTVLYTKFQV